MSTFEEALQQRQREVMDVTRVRTPETSGFMVEIDQETLESLKRDAARYRYLRDEDNWGDDSGEDSGEDCWAILGEVSWEAFDEIVDSRMAKEKENVRKTL